MRRRMSAGIALALLLGLAASVRGADPDPSTSGGWSWMPSWLGGKKKPAPKKEPELQVLEKPRPTPEDPASNLRQKEANAFYRRQEALDKLELLAFQAGDEEQIRRIHQLKDRIWAVYLKRTASLSTSPAGAEMDEALLEKNLGTNTRRPDLLQGEAAGGKGSGVANWWGTK